MESDAAERGTPTESAVTNSYNRGWNVNAFQAFAIRKSTASNISQTIRKRYIGQRGRAEEGKTINVR